MKTRLSYRVADFARKHGVNFNSEKDPKIVAMRAEIKDLGSINFFIEQATDGEWWARSTNIEGILSGGSSKDNIDAMLRDAIFTYYGISPKHCDDKLLQVRGEPKIIQQEVLAVA